MTTKPTQLSDLGRALLSEFLDDRALAAELNISPRTPAQWRFTGKFAKELPFHRFGRAIRYRREDVEAFIAASRVGGAKAVEDQ
ncbi:helix-turn-helix domain-containing protein [Ralstonia solanacearum]|uniref:helix-turn-helix domain-containing protein n=1 Tax=Ralstonia solanacearum TaxID=305 RepID=UPI000E94A24B|nr:helix-turn-helix domain-containing protein [Ralstonia solanacearum]AXW24561.1 hypothetical protein CJO86_13840 [Ralstonia solanacearum]